MFDSFLLFIYIIILVPLSSIDLSIHMLIHWCVYMYVHFILLVMCELD